ncbi:MAG: C25 family cysteine peptidase [Candidatus Hatepunaea meridiana]|nr:C25 family cysteine peptidase [Candidatus Hatepunaea meridiana]
MHFKPFLSSIIISLLFLFTSVLASQATDEQVRIVTSAEGPNGFTVVLEFQTPTLVAGRDVNGNAKLRVDLPGAIPDFESEGPALPTVCKLVAVPDGHTVSMRISDLQEIRYDVERVISRDDMPVRTLHSTTQPPAVMVGEAGWMRWQRVVPVVIHPAQYITAEHQLACAQRMEIEFEFVPDGSYLGTTPDRDRYQSQAFEDFFKAMLLNYNTSGAILPGGRVIQRGSYLIITDDRLAPYAEEFAECKRRKGFNVVIEPLYVQNETTREEIKDYIQDAYDNWERPPEFVLLLGDVEWGNMHLPTFYIDAPAGQETDPTDIPYVLLEGDDYFMDAFIGRISCDSPNPGTLQRALARYIKHELHIADIAENNPGAFHRATLFGGNYGQSGRPISSPVETCRWLGERLRNRGFDVEEFYYEKPGDDLNPDPIVESINRSVNIVAYRGWADATGPHYPRFHKDDLERLTNYPLLPIMTFFVCNTGDFDNNLHTECFGEYSITRGTMNTPEGALVFYGPSDLHTKTVYNNPMLGGFYFSLLYRNQRVFGPLTLAAKMDMWRSFPHKRNIGNDIEFYTHVYNILGDPEVNVYLDPPFNMNVELDIGHQGQLSVGDTYMQFTVSNERSGNPIRGAMVNLRKTDEVEISVLTDTDGVALVPVQLGSEGELEITVIAFQAAPYMETIQVQAAQRNVGFAEVTVSNQQDDDRLLTGEPVDLTVTLRNTGNATVSGITAELSCVLNGVEIEVNEADFENIPAGETSVANSPYTVILDHTIPSAEYVPLQLDITDSQDNNYRSLFRLPISTGIVQYRSYAFADEFIDPGETSDLIITVCNAGSADLSGLYADIRCYDNSIEIADGEAVFGDIAAGETGDCSGNPFQIRVMDNVADGRQVQLIPHFYDANDRLVNSMPFNIVIGEVGIDDPIGPDAYGYYAYEDIDDRDRYDEAPEFEWIELDPEHDGIQGAEHHSLRDDSTFVMELPFNFIFYGDEYDSIAICSNGWISFEASMTYYNFRNWGIPSPLGPHTMIAPMWEDLVGEAYGEDHRHNLNIFTYYDEENGRFIIEWSRVYARTNIDHLQTFELILYNPELERYQTRTGDGIILFQYLNAAIVDLNETNYATVGIQDWLHLRGLEITYANLYHPAAAELAAERAIKFTTGPPDAYLPDKNDATLQPITFGLEEPYPNPFNSSVKINYNLTNSGLVQLALWDTNGRMVKDLISGNAVRGRNSITLNAGTLPSSIYIIRLEAKGMTSQKKLILLQ